MANPKEKKYEVSLNVAVTKAMKEEVKEFAWQQRMNEREFIRFCIANTIRDIKRQQAAEAAQASEAAQG